MGRVYLAEDRLNNDQKIAIKEINEKKLNKKNLNIFKKEFNIMNRLIHPNLVRVFNFGRDIDLKSYFKLEIFQHIGRNINLYSTKNQRHKQAQNTN